MKTKVILSIMAFLAIAGFIAAAYGEYVQACFWECSGSADCSATQSDQCRTKKEANGANWKYKCEGTCVRSNSGATIKTCVQVKTESECNYEGGRACSGTYQTKDCATATASPPDSGQLCTGECTGDWSSEKNGYLWDCS